MIIKVALVISACLAFHSVEPAATHELEDGYVEKAVEVVIRDNKAILKYYVGLNENTAEELAQNWAQNQLSNGQPVKNQDDFGGRLLRQLAKSVSIQINGSRRILRPVNSSNPGKHHFSYVAELEFDLDAGKNEIEIVDGEFKHMIGGARYSLKALGSTIVLKSSVAPIIIRAKRHELKQKDTVRPSEICTISAIVATDIPASKPDEMISN